MWGDTLQLLLILGFALAAVGIISRRPGRRRRHREESGSAEPRHSSAVSQQLLDQLARIEERVRVLERIVTDDPQELRRQFRDLSE